MKPSGALSPILSLAVLGWILAASSVSGQAAAMTPAAMQEGIEFVVSKIQTVHPMARDRLPAATVAAADAARAKIGGPLPSSSYYFILSELVASLRDAHSQVHLQPDRAAAFPALPLPFVWLEDGMVLSEDAGPFQRGDAVVSIGGQSPEEIFRNLSRVLSTENDYHLRAIAPHTLVRQEYLDHLGLIDSSGKVSIRIRHHGELQEIRLALEQDPRKPDEKPLFQFEIDPDRSLGIFRIDSCLYSEEYKTKLHEFMTAVDARRIQRILIDLRHNTGGNILAAFAFLNYLDAEYRSFSVRQRISEAFMEQYAHFAREDFLKLLSGYGVDPASKFYSLPGGAVQAVMNQMLEHSGPAVEERLKFRGELYVLTSNATFSSANLFASLIQDNHLGQIVGEPTGNEVNFHGQPVRFDIPGTDFQLQLATSRNVRPDPSRENQEAVFPDIPVPTTAEDVRIGRDPQIGHLKHAVLEHPDG